MPGTAEVHYIPVGIASSGLESSSAPFDERQRCMGRNLTKLSVLESTIGSDEQPTIILTTPGQQSLHSSLHPHQPTSSTTTCDQYTGVSGNPFSMSPTHTELELFDPMDVVVYPRAAMASEKGVCEYAGHATSPLSNNRSAVPKVEDYITAEDDNHCDGMTSGRTSATLVMPIDVASNFLDAGSVLLSEENMSRAILQKNRIATLAQIQAQIRDLQSKEADLQRMCEVEADGQEIVEKLAHKWVSIFDILEQISETNSQYRLTSSLPLVKVYPIRSP